MPTLLRLFSVLPLWLLHGLGWTMGWLVFVLSPRYRHRFVENAARAGYAFAQVRAAVGHAGRMAAELPRLWLGELPACRFENAECVERAWAAGKGIVFLTPHIGCFELSVQAAAQRWSSAYAPITILYRPTSALVGAGHAHGAQPPRCAGRAHRAGRACAA